MGIELKVTHEPLVSTRDLALHLAEALQSTIFAEKDAAEYLNQIRTENQKLSQLRITLDQATRYQANPPPNPSRMDPLLQYDLGMIQEEIDQCRDRVEEWTRLREDFLNKAQELKAETARIQKELAERKKRGD